MSFERPVVRVDAIEVTWIGARLMDWAASMRWVQRDDVWAHDVFGVGGILFEVGDGRSRWPARLAAYDWFSGFAPHPEDLAVGEEPSGGWTMPSGAGEVSVASFLASSHVPEVLWWAAIAVTPETGMLKEPLSSVWSARSDSAAPRLETRSPL